MKKEFKIGIFAVIILTTSVFVLNYLKGEDILNRETEYVSSFSNLEGLVVSAPVYVKGYKAGKVTDIEYEAASDRFLVTCSVSKQFQIPEDSRIVLYSVDIMGGKGIRIDCGTSEVTAPDGASLLSVYEAGLLDQLSATAGPLLSKAEQMIDSLGVTVSGVNRILSDANVASVNETLGYLKSSMKELESFISNMNGNTDDIRVVVSNIKAVSENINKLVAELDTLVSDADTAVAAINSADLAGTVNSLKQLLDSMNNPAGSLGKLLSDDVVHNSVDSLLNNLNQLVSKIQENPKKYLKISVF